MTNVTVIDAIMGTGKTNYAIKRMNEAPEDERFIYITPFLSEVERIISSVKTRSIVQPTRNAANEGSKLRSLKDAITEGYDIASTHALFMSADDELISLLDGAGYTLVLDEVMDVVEPVEVKGDDIRILLDAGRIRIEDNRIIWLDPTYDAHFNDLKLYAEAENLFIYRDTYVLWAFPSRVFDCFKETVILTYLFEAQNMSYYFKLHGISYSIETIVDGEIVPYDVKHEQRPQLYHLIDIYDGKMNDTKNRYAYSARWLRNRKSTKDGLTEVKRNLTNYVRNILNAPSDAIMWSTLKAVEASIKGKGYTKSSIPVNARATNEYADKWALAYIFNRFKNPYENSFFTDNGIPVNEDLLAVSDLLQWIWRSRIRNGQPISLYIPSSRMRSLLLAWSKYEI